MDYELWGTLPFPNHTLRCVRLPGIKHDKATTEPWGALRPSLRRPVSPRSKPTSARNAPGPRRLRGGRATGGALATAAMSDPFPLFLESSLGGVRGLHWSTSGLPAGCLRGERVQANRETLWSVFCGVQGRSPACVVRVNLRSIFVGRYSAATAVAWVGVSLVFHV